MRLIHPALARRFRDHALTVALAMLLVGATSVLLMALLPPTRVAPIALLCLSGALAFGVGGAMAWRSVASMRRRSEAIGDDLGKLLASAFDDSYTLVLAPRLPGVSEDLAALLIGPPGVRAIVTRRWRSGWIPTMTNPSFEADSVAESVARWVRATLDDSTVAISPAIVFPRPYTKVVLEEPIGEVVTADNAPWWAASIGRVQRLDPRRAAAFVEAVLSASEMEATGARMPSPNAA